MLRITFSSGNQAIRPSRKYQGDFQWQHGHGAHFVRLRCPACEAGRSYFPRYRIDAVAAGGLVCVWPCQRWGQPVSLMNAFISETTAGEGCSSNHGLCASALSGISRSGILWRVSSRPFWSLTTQENYTPEEPLNGTARSFLKI